MAEVAAIFVSPLLQVLFEKLASREFADFFGQRKLSLDLVWELKIEFLAFNTVLEDAEDLQDIKPTVKEWLDELKDVVHDAEDVLDEIATEALRSQLEPQIQTLRSKVRKRFSASPISVVKEMEQKINGVLKRLKVLRGQINDLGLKEHSARSQLERHPTSSLVDASMICGRDGDKAAIVNALLSDDAANNGVSVIAIVGMGGLGKTTLARLVYNDRIVRGHFDCFAWVCVSDKFDLVMITKKILECLKPSDDTQKTQNIEVLQNGLKQQLSGKKFLFVLDDDWNKNFGVWDDFIMPFKSGKQGSKIIVTAREDDVASVRAAGEPYRPRRLGENDGWSLFSKFAFADKDPVKNQELEELGKQIVGKCKGLPLAIKTIGALLGSSSNIDYWTKILDNPLWDKTDILPSLRISYKNLSSPLKRCFAYCSLFPKDYVFKKKKLILLWMAEGFLHKSNSQTLEQIGDEYFSTLVSRSFFEKPIDDKSNDESDDYFSMHDLVNDLAVSVSTLSILRLESGNSQHTKNKVHHLSYVIEDFKDWKKFEFSCEANKLRTFLPLTFRSFWHNNFYFTKKVWNELLPTLKCLRVLSLSGYKDIRELPSSIGEFKHLRYLNLSKIRVERLSDSICLLCNLQTLDISYCSKLVALPKEMWKLINLRHLILIGTNIKEMPMQLGKLKSLQTLGKFIVGNHSESCIGELRKLTNLQGSLHISNLQNVESPSDIGLRDRRYLQELELEWDSSVDISKCQRLVLDALQPHSNLKRLDIQHYHGESFSDWVGNPLFSNLAIVKLMYCSRCKTLPPLGQLSSLQKLYIYGFNEVISVGSEFYGSSPSLLNPFGALKLLEFSGMAKWEKWILYEAKNESMAFPQLETLIITGCPELSGGLPVHAPLARLDVGRCPKLMAPLPRSIRRLNLSECNLALSKDLPAGLESVEIYELEALESLFETGIPPALKSLQIDSCEQLKSLFEGTRDSNICLENLSIQECPSFMSLPEKGDLLSKLTNLKIRGCGKIESFPEEALNSNNCLQQLEIAQCSSLMSLPKGGLPSTLEYLDIISCDKLESFPKDGLPSSLGFLSICNCIKLELPTPPYYSALKYLRLWGCDSLETFPLDLFSELYLINIRECRNLKSLSLPENYEHDLVTTHISINCCPKFVSFPKGGLPARSLTWFCLKYCESMKSLPDNMHKLLPSLESLDLANCPKLEVFPERDFPRNLKSIVIDCKLATSRMGWGLLNLPFLKDLQIFGKSQDVASFPEKQLLPTTLTSLKISDFPNLKSLDKKGFQHLSVLETLRINRCPKLKHLPKLGLSASPSTIEICDCPLLKNWCQSKEGKKWLKATHVERIWSHGEWIG